MDVSNSVDVLFRHQAYGHGWTDIVRQAAAHAKAVGAELLIIDTLPEWAQFAGDSENSAGAILEAMRPLQEAAASGLAVLIIAHQRKMAGEYGEAIRGSSALIGAVDIVMELERPSSDQLDAEGVRVLRAVSRFEGTPPEAVVKLTDEGYEWCGDVLAARGEGEKEKVLTELRHAGEVTADELAEATHIPKGTIHKRLKELLETDAVERAGMGNKGDPYRWKIHSSQ